VHFGLGKNGVVQEIQVRWPSGIVQILKDVRANQILQIDEPSESRAGSRKRERYCAQDARVGLIFRACVCAIGSSAQTSGDLALGLSEFAREFQLAAAFFARAEEAARHHDALLYESKAYVHLERFTAAEGALRRYLLAHAASSDALYLLGYVLHREGKAAESLETYTKAAQHRTPAGMI